MRMRFYIPPIHSVKNTSKIALRGCIQTLKLRRSEQPLLCICTTAPRVAALAVFLTGMNNANGASGITNCTPSVCSANVLCYNFLKKIVTVAWDGFVTMSYRCELSMNKNNVVIYYRKEI